MEKEIITLADQEINERIENHEHFLKHIEKLVDWKKIRSVLNQVELKRDSVAGRDAYSAEVMFRIMLIQFWYSLSDYQMEDQLICNRMFLWFSQLSMDNIVPDMPVLNRRPYKR